MLSLVGEKLVSLEVHTALGSPWEWAEYLNTIYHVGARGEEAENRRGKETGLQESKTGMARDETRSRGPGL